MTELQINGKTLDVDGFSYGFEQNSDPIADLQSEMRAYIVQPSIMWMSTTTAAYLAEAGERILAMAVAAKNKAALRLVRARLNVARASRRNRLRAKREVSNATRAFINSQHRHQSAQSMRFFMPCSAALSDRNSAESSHSVS